MTGAGSGGHITPLLAVAHELKQQDPKTKIIYIGQKGDSLGDVPAQDKSIDTTYMIRAGKLRRYHGEGWRQLLDMPTLFKNLRDMVWTVVGLWQSYWLLRKLMPDAIFIKGGFVGVPVGLSAASLHIPYITHDSDAMPGLANRIIAQWARLHAVALPKEIYKYPASKTETVGVPLSRFYRPFTEKEVAEARKRIGLPAKSHVVLVTGGGLGADRLNDAVLACAPELLERYKDLWIVHLSGRPHETAVRQKYQKLLEPEAAKRVIVKGFVTDLYWYSGASDIVVSRAGATSIAESAAQKKACIVVPNPVLAGGHQLKNAEVLAERKAVLLVSSAKLQQDHRALMPALVSLLDNPAMAQALGERLSALSEPHSAERLAELLRKVAAQK